MNTPIFNFDYESGTWPTSHVDHMRQALEIFSRRGHTLQRLSGPKHLNRSMDTLKRYCRLFRIEFTDYCPQVIKRERQRHHD